MCSFTYEEQGNKRYLVYEKKPDDSMDILTLEMMSNNRIDGLVPVSHTQIDDCFYMKYDITGLQSLREYFQIPVNRKKFFSILESILSAVMMAEEYMLTLTSYVLNLDYMYVDSAAFKVFMVVLPIVRSELSLEMFLKQLLIDVKYDQTEDCSYVAMFSNLLGNLKPFSASALKEQIIRQSFSAKSGQKPVLESQRREKNILPKVQVQEKPKTDIKERGSSLDADKQRCFDILFSNEETPKKEKKGLFFKKDKSDKSGKTEKKSFWKKRKEDAGKIPEMEALFGGFQIPGRNQPVCGQDEIYSEGGGANHKADKFPKQDVSIPVQKVGMNRVPVEMQYVEEATYFEAEDEEATVLMEDYSMPELILIRRSTNESFRIEGTVVRVGRSHTATEILIEGNKRVGRVHAILHVQDGEVYIEDNHSKNCTFVNGVQIMPQDRPCRLEPGSKIRLGDEELEFQIRE